jgi:hypothetical protein
MHAAGELGRKDCVNHAVTFHAAFPTEGIRHDRHPEMALAPRPLAGVSRVLVGFVNDIETLRRESLGQLVRDEILDRHGICLRNPVKLVNRRSRRKTKNVSVKT